MGFCQSVYLVLVGMAFVSGMWLFSDVVGQTGVALPCHVPLHLPVRYPTAELESTALARKTTTVLYHRCRNRSRLNPVLMQLLLPRLRPLL